MYIVTASEMQQMDRMTIEDFGIPGRVLMEVAGRGAFETFSGWIPDLQKKRVGVVAGRGNNGGDGFVIARCLASAKVDVTIFLLSEKGLVAGDAAANLMLAEKMGLEIFCLPDMDSFLCKSQELARMDLLIDAILGTGLKSDVKGYFRDVIEFINELKKPVFSVDMPSGISSETGGIRGAAVSATGTVTFAYPKLGHFLHPGAALTGKLKVIDIGIPPQVADSVAPLQYLITPEIVKELLPERKSDAHKGDGGHLLVLAGSPGKTGAAIMTSVSALRAGAGLVTLALPEKLNRLVEPMTPEVMTAPLVSADKEFPTISCFDEIISHMEQKSCLALGPGIGTDPRTCGLVYELLKSASIPVVIDADALNCISFNKGILKDIRCPAVLTPHPGEMARLIGKRPRELQKDRVTAARELAQASGKTVVLKGAGTVIADPCGRVYLNPTGNPGMAAGGMGDILTGIIAGFICQGLSPTESAIAGVYLHGAAADALAGKMGPCGYLASEVADALPTVTMLNSRAEIKKPLSRCAS